MNSAIFIFALTLLSPPLIAQRGGAAEILYHFDGYVESENFGTAVASAGDVDGDGTLDIIVGDSHAMGGTWSGLGEAYVYSGASGALLHRFTGGNPLDGFGGSVDGVGDVNSDGYDDVIIGAPGADTGFYTDNGSAFVYSGFDGALLFRFDGDVFANDQRFGQSVSGLGDINQDGVNEFLVSAPGAWSNFQTDVGAVFVFSGADGALLFRFDGDFEDDFFGYRVDDAGDVNADGVSDIYASSLAERNGFYSAGFVRIFSGADGTLLHEIVGDSNGRLFGVTGGGAGDVNGDGFDDIVIGAYSYAAGIDASVLVYSGRNGSLIHRVDDPKLVPTACGAGDVDGDGFDDIVVGSQWSNPGGIRSGAVYAISGATGRVLHRFYIPNSQGEKLGVAIAGVGDLNGDGLADILAGALDGVSASGLRNGSAYVFSFDPLIHSDSYTVSASNGGSVNLDMDFPSAARGYQYQVLMSYRGTGPIWHGAWIPLSEDFMLRQSSRGNYPFQNHFGLQGVLDLNGDASASISIAPNEIPARLVGRHCWFAAVVGQSSSMQAQFSSVAVPLKVTP